MDGISGIKGIPKINMLDMDYNLYPLLFIFYTQTSEVQQAWRSFEGLRTCGRPGEECPLAERLFFPVPQ